VISILLPTRNRPANVTRLIESARKTAAGRFEFIICVDNDDPTRNQVLDQVTDDVRVVVTARQTLSKYWNECADHAKFDVLMQCGDDIIFQTDAWDIAVLRAFDDIPDKIALVHGDDGIQNGNIATHGFLHRRWMDTVGYFVPPYFASDYNDLWLTEVANALNRRVYLPNVYTEHMHPVIGKGPLDQTHQERLNRHVQENCDQVWRETEHLRRADVEKLRAVMGMIGDATLEYSHSNDRSA